MFVVLKFAKGSPLGNPFAPINKSSALGAAGLAAAGSVVGNLLGGLFGSSSQDSANETNLELGRMNMQSQRETNEMNRYIAAMTNNKQYQMFKEQNAFNLDMWNKTNEWNSESAKVQRMLAAGLNPAMMFGQGANASSIQSANAPNMVTPDLQAPINNAHVQAFDPTAAFSGASSALLQALNWKTNADLSKSQANYNNVKATNEALQGLADLSLKASHVKKNSAEYQQLMQAIDIRKRTMEDEVTQMTQSTKLGERAINEADLRITSMKLQNDILSINKEWLPKMNAASYAQIQAGIRNALSAASLNDAQAVESAARTAVENAREAGMKIDNDSAKQMQEAIVLGAYYEADKKRHEAGNERRRYWEGVGSRLPFTNLNDNISQGSKMPDFTHYYKAFKK